ncbi:transposase, IS4 family protein, partial [mine drainage metagenome]
MRGADVTQESLFSTVQLHTFVPADHPLREVRELFNEALKHLDGVFNLAYAPYGQESIAPEQLLRALMLQVFYSIRSERALREQVQYNLLFRWFIGLSID